MTRYPITPCPAPRMNVRSRFNPEHKARIERYHAFKDECRARRVHVPERAHVVFYMPVPKSKAGMKRVGLPHKQKPDLDNLVKGLLDAVLAEDSHVWMIQAEKRWAFAGEILIGELP